jgi:hypothetical protein
MRKAQNAGDINVRFFITCPYAKTTRDQYVMVTTHRYVIIYYVSICCSYYMGKQRCVSKICICNLPVKCQNIVQGGN